MKIHRDSNYYSGKLSDSHHRNLLHKTHRMNKDKDIVLLEIDNCYVNTTTSLVYDSDGNLIPETMDEYIFWKPYPIVRYAQKALQRQDDQVLDEILYALYQDRYASIQKFYNFSKKEIKHHLKNNTYVHLIDAHGWYPFGHFTDTLQRTLVFCENIVSMDKSEFSYILNDVSNLKNFFIWSAPFSIKAANCLPFKKDLWLRVDKLLYPFAPSYTTRWSEYVYENYIYNPLLKRLNQSKIEKRVIDVYGSPPYRLYLKRYNERNGRNVIGENFDNLNDLIVLDGNEPLLDKIYLFSNASHVYGPHGSMFIHTVFCSEDCKIYEFCPSNRLDDSIMTRHKKCKNYNQILCEATEDFQIQFQDILAYI